LIQAPSLILNLLIARPNPRVVLTNLAVVVANIFLLLLYRPPVGVLLPSRCRLSVSQRPVVGLPLPLMGALRISRSTLHLSPSLRGRQSPHHDSMVHRPTDKPDLCSI
jgi:hypothetical protein